MAPAERHGRRGGEQVDILAVRRTAITSHNANTPGPLAGICFDALGTLFDLDPLLDEIDDEIGPGVGDAFSDHLGPWTWLLTAADRYQPFDDVARSALLAAAAERGHRLDQGTATNLLDGLDRLPLMAGAREALQELKPAHLAILSNCDHPTLRSLVARAGVDSCLRHLLSAGQVGRFKPAPQVYALTSIAFGVSSDRVLMVSAHAWDIAGARMAGMRTAWIARGRAQASAVGVEADLVVDSLAMLPDVLSAAGLIGFEPAGTILPGRPVSGGAGRRRKPGPDR